MAKLASMKISNNHLFHRKQFLFWEKDLSVTVVFETRNELLTSLQPFAFIQFTEKLTLLNLYVFICKSFRTILLIDSLQICTSFAIFLMFLERFLRILWDTQFILLSFDFQILSYLLRFKIRVSTLCASFRTSHSWAYSPLTAVWSPTGQLAGCGLDYGCGRRRTMSIPVRMRAAILGAKRSYSCSSDCLVLRLCQLLSSIYD